VVRTVKESGDELETQGGLLWKVPGMISNLDEHQKFFVYIRCFTDKVLQVSIGLKVANWVQHLELLEFTAPWKHLRLSMEAIGFWPVGVNARQALDITPTARWACTSAPVL
jgi:hypothetical protein